MPRTWPSLSVISLCRMSTGISVPSLRRKVRCVASSRSSAAISTGMASSFGSSTMKSQTGRPTISSARVAEHRQLRVVDAREAVLGIELVIGHRRVVEEIAELRLALLQARARRGVCLVMSMPTPPSSLRPPVVLIGNFSTSHSIIFPSAVGTVSFTRDIAPEESTCRSFSVTAAATSGGSHS